MGLDKLVCSFYDRDYMEIRKRNLERWKDLSSPKKSPS